MPDSLQWPPGQEPVYIMAAEFLGKAECVDGFLDIGGVKVPFRDCDAYIYVRRNSRDFSVAEIHLASHDGYAQEVLDEQNKEAERYPLGVKEYWRGEMVGKYTMGLDGHVMTNEDFEADWAEHDD